MKEFDLNEHYDRAGKATTSELIAEVREEFRLYYNSLSESEQAVFKLQVEEHARQQVALAKGQLAFLNRILAESSAAV